MQPRAASVDEKKASTGMDIKASTGAGKSFSDGVDKSFNGREKTLQTDVQAVTLRVAAGGTVVL